jgi:hypothetical protein
MSEASAASGHRSERDHCTYYEVHRACEPGKRGVARAPVVEEYLGLDRARLAALGYALDGPTATGSCFTGTVTIHRILALGQKKFRTDLVDCIDERVAFRLLNEMVFPNATQLKVPVEALQAESERLEWMGF